MKRATSTLIIFCSLLAQHTSVASSKQAPFGIASSRGHGGSSDATFISRRKSRHRSSSHRSDHDHRSRNRDAQVSVSEYGESHLAHSESQRTHAQAQTSDGLDTEQKQSPLLQVPMAVSLQKEGHSGSKHAVPISTFLDTGAQVTIMTLNAAKRAGIAHLIDTRYSGQATGVAGVSCRVLGRVPANSVSFAVGYGDDIVDKSPPITILEGSIMGGDSIDMLLGLDVLEDWQAMVCLRDRTLTVRSGCRRSENKKYVIPFVGKNQNSSRGKHRSGSKSKRNSSSSSSSSSRDNLSASSHQRGTTNPFARDSSLLESELDALDERSGRQFGDGDQDNQDFDSYDDFYTDDDEESYYFSDSDAEFEGNLSLGCDLSGI